jgi:hypothetical protein
VEWGHCSSWVGDQQHRYKDKGITLTTRPRRASHDSAGLSSVFPSPGSPRSQRNGDGKDLNKSATLETKSRRGGIGRTMICGVRTYPGRLDRADVS